MSATNVTIFTATELQHTSERPQRLSVQYCTEGTSPYLHVSLGASVASVPVYLTDISKLQVILSDIMHNRMRLDGEYEERFEIVKDRLYVILTGYDTVKLQFIARSGRIASYTFHPDVNYKHSCLNRLYFAVTHIMMHKL